MLYDLTLVKETNIIPIFGEIDDKLINFVETCFIKLSNESHDDITVIINSPGGRVDYGLAIIDMMMSVQNKIITKVIGNAYSMGAMILLAGDERYAKLHSRIMLHQVIGGFRGKYDDVEIYKRELDFAFDTLKSLIMLKTNMDEKTMLEILKKDTYMNPYEAKRYGIIDDVEIPNKYKAILDKLPDDRKNWLKENLYDKWNIGITI